MVRTNEFIAKLKGTKQTQKNTPPVSQKVTSLADFESRLTVFESLEEAMFAAELCTKCVRTVQGTKGCTWCMGKDPQGRHWFEQIRLKATPPKWIRQANINIAG